MTGADDALERLQQAVSDQLTPMATSVQALRHAHGRFSGGADLVESMTACAGLIVALEAVEAVAQQAAGHLRSTLAVMMMETGATTLRSGSHVISTKRGARRAVITKKAAIPPELMVPQPATPDMAEITRRLKNGEQLDFAELTNGGAPTLQIKAADA